MSIRVVNVDGAAPDYRLVLIRDWICRGFLGVLVIEVPAVGVLGVVGIVVGPTLFAVAAIWCIWDSRRQCLWAKLFGTYVVYA